MNLSAVSSSSGCSETSIFECGKIVSGELELHVEQCNALVSSGFEILAAAGAMFSKTANSFAMISKS